MIHLKIAEVRRKPVIQLDEAVLTTLGCGWRRRGDEAVEATPVERGKAFVERYIKTFEALAK